MTPPELSTSPPVTASTDPAPRVIAADAPFIVVMNAGSGRRQSDETRAALDDILGRAGRKFEVRLVADPSQLADTARQAVRDAKAQKRRGGRCGRRRHAVRGGRGSTRQRMRVCGVAAGHVQLFQP